nr:MAG TPA: hypothetical protein [Caudoviricetes sp.]
MKKKEAGDQREDARKSRPKAERITGKATLATLFRLPCQVTQQQRQRREDYHRDDPFDNTHLLTSHSVDEVSSLPRRKRVV